MPITKGAFSALVSPDLRRVFFETGKDRPNEFEYVFNVDQMEWNPQTDRQVSGLGTLTGMGEGEQFDLDEPILGGTKSYEATAFGLAVEITWIMWRDELYGVMRELIGELARSSKNRMEVSAWSILNNAFSTSFTGFTASEALCGAHVGLDGVTRRNRPPTDIEFSVTGVQSAVQRYEDMTNERGLPRLMAPTMAIVTSQYKWAAREILGSTGRPYSTDNEMNSLIEEDLSWMISHYLTTATYWFLLASKGIHDLNFLWRDEPIFDSFDDPWTKNAIFTVYQRHTQGFGTWRGIDGSTGA